MNAKTAKTAKKNFPWLFFAPFAAFAFFFSAASE